MNHALKSPHNLVTTDQIEAYNVQARIRARRTPSGYLTGPRMGQELAGIRQQRHAVVARLMALHNNRVST